MISQRACHYIILIICFACTCCAESSTQRPQYVCQQVTDNAIKIDGLDNDAAWKHAQAITQLTPCASVSRAQSNTIKLAWDIQYLYFFAQLSDEHIHSTFTKRDEHLYNQDAFEIFIQPDPNDKNYVELQWSPNNVIFDYLLLHPGQKKRRAIGGFDIKGMLSAVAKNETGWSVEGAIPFSELNIGERIHIPPQHDDKWRFLIARCDINKANEYMQNSWPKTTSVHDKNHYADLLFQKIAANDVAQRKAAARNFKGLPSGKHWSFADNIFDVKAYSNTCQYKKTKIGWKSTNKWGALRRVNEQVPPGLAGKPVVFLHPNRKDRDPTIIEMPVKGYTQAYLWLRMTDTAAATIHSGLADGVAVSAYHNDTLIMNADVVDEEWQLITFDIKNMDMVKMIVEQGPISLNSDHCLAVFYLCSE